MLELITLSLSVIGGLAFGALAAQARGGEGDTLFGMSLRYVYKLVGRVFPKSQPVKAVWEVIEATEAKEERNLSPDLVLDRVLERTKKRTFYEA